MSCKLRREIMVMIPTIPGVRRTEKTLSSGVKKVYFYETATSEYIGSDYNTALSEMERRRGANPSREMNFADYIREYTRSNKFQYLAKSTKANARFHLTALESEFGAMTRSQIQEEGSRQIFYKHRDRIGKTNPCKADAHITWLKIVLNDAFDRETLSRNPAAGIPKIYRSERAEIIWPPEAIQAIYTSATSAPMKLAVTLALHTGQREGDLTGLTWDQYDGNYISLIPSKTERVGRPGRRVVVPVTPELKIKLDRELSRRREENPHTSLDKQRILRPPKSVGGK